MRSIGGAIVAIALASSSIVMTTAPGGAASNPSCHAATGNAKFTPTLPKSSASKKVSAVLSATGKFSGCTGTPASGASVKLKSSKTSLNCKTWLTYNAKAKPTPGTETITWSGGQTSTVKLTLSQVKGKPTQRRLFGTVTSGAMQGYRQDGTVNFTLPKKACKSTGLSTMTYQQVTATTFASILPPP